MGKSKDDNIDVRRDLGGLCQRVMRTRQREGRNRGSTRVFKEPIEISTTKGGTGKEEKEERCELEGVDRDGAN